MAQDEQEYITGYACIFPLEWGIHLCQPICLGRGDAEALAKRMSGTVNGTPEIVEVMIKPDSRITFPREEA